MEEQLKIQFYEYNSGNMSDSRKNNATRSQIYSL